MKIIKKALLPVAMLAAVFGSAAARAQTPNDKPAVPTAQSSTTITTIDEKWALKPQTVYGPTITTDTPKLSDSVNRAVLAEVKPADVDGKPAFNLHTELAAEKARRESSASPDAAPYGPTNNDGRWDNKTYRFRPEITVPGPWNSDNSHVTLSPKGRGVMIGIKIKTN